MPSIRHTETTTGERIACPPPNRWLAAGTLVKGLGDPAKKGLT